MLLLFFNLDRVSYILLQAKITYIYLATIQLEMLQYPHPLVLGLESLNMVKIHKEMPLSHSA
uniref:Uncharacterized protein n=1 Tax=Arundo donax TaxID=35708 RepID=A0A0A9DD08_ARUDO